MSPSSKITILPYISPRCKTCGRDLPKGRRARCYDCLPRRQYKPPEPPRPELPYTLEDRVAQADAHGMSYGNFMAFVHNKWRLPPKLRPIRWPMGSQHVGE